MPADPDDERADDGDEAAPATGPGDGDDREGTFETLAGSAAEESARRRTLIRLLVGLGIGIPLLVEGLTFLGLLRSHVDGDGGDGEPTTSVRRVGVGDDLLPATPQSETVTESIVRANGTWTYRLGVAVENVGEAPYELRLGAVTAGGQTVEGGATVGPVPPGGEASATGTWELPAGTRPDAVAVTGVLDPGGGETTTAERVDLASPPVRR